MDANKIPEKFRAQRGKVQALRVSSRQFSDLWADYCEVLDSLAPVEGKTRDLQRLRDDLEREIAEQLENKG